jgi:hypothetical protein
MEDDNQTVHIEASMDFERAERIILFLIERDFNITAKQQTNKWEIIATSSKIVDGAKIVTGTIRESQINSGYTNI